MDLLDVFRDSEDLIDLAEGDVLFTEGSKGDTMYVIVAGRLRLSLHGQTITTIEAGAIVGEMAILDDDVRSATATAATDCRMAPIDVHSFKSLVQNMPEFALHVMRVLAIRLRQVNEALTAHV